MSRSQLLKYAVIACIFTIVWNVAEGVVSVFFGDENDSVSLIFFGVDSFIEVTSACLVLWRFLTESRPDEEKAAQVLEENLGKERKATMGIGSLFLLLSVATVSDATVSLIKRKKPETATAGLIISSVSLSFMGFLYAGKKYLAKMLDSSTMASEAQCSLACIKITLVLFIGNILYIVWKNGWWLDSAAAITLGVLFAKEGVEMVLWARSKDFNGGCCKNKCCENEKERNKKYFIVDRLTSFFKGDRLSFRKSISTNKEDKKLDCCANEFDKSTSLEKSEKCCGGNNETKQSSCCIKEIKDSTIEIKISTDNETNEKVSTQKDVESQSQDKIDVVKTEKKESSCACCHE